MSRVRPPGDAELKTALEAAQRMRNRDVDPHHIAHCLLYLWERARLHETLYRQADRYLGFGMDDRELSRLRQTVEKLREQKQVDAGEDPDLPV